MKVDNFFCFVVLCWNFPNQIVSCNAIDIFENLTMSTSALTWVENFWSYDVKVIDYWTILLVNIHKIINKNYIRIRRYIWCCWKVVVELDLMKFISWFSYLKVMVWKILNFEWIFLLKTQKNYKKLGLKRKMSWVCSHLGPTTHVTLSIHEGR
jgi:hypothetical protein